MYKQQNVRKPGQRDPRSTPIATTQPVRQPYNVPGKPQRPDPRSMPPQATTQPIKQTFNGPGKPAIDPRANPPAATTQPIKLSPPVQTPPQPPQGGVGQLINRKGGGQPVRPAGNRKGGGKPPAVSGPQNDRRAQLVNALRGRFGMR